MASQYTPNYNLDLYARNDKPNLRDQYNAAMGKVDTAIMGNANAVSATNTAVTNLTTRVSNDEKKLTDTISDLDDLQQDVNGKAANSHAAPTAVHGSGDAGNWGHVKLSDATNSTSNATGGTAATPAAVKSAMDTAGNAATAAGNASSLAQTAKTTADTASATASSAQTAAALAQSQANTANTNAQTAIDYSLNFTIFGDTTMTAPYPLASESHLRYALTESKNILKLYGRFSLMNIPNPGIGGNQVIATASGIPFTPPSAEFTVDGLGSLYIHKEPSTYGLYPLSAKVRTDGKIDLIAPGLAGWVGDIVAVAIAVPIVMKSFGD
jgi:hypothetical protein